MMTRGSTRCCRRKARSSSEQTLFMTEGLHYALPQLLIRSSDGPGSSAAVWLMKAQAARLMANLAYQPPHKGPIVEAGGLRALSSAAHDALRHAFAPGPEDASAAAALLLEAAAAIGNLASGADARRSVVDGDSHHSGREEAWQRCQQRWHQ